MCRHLTAAHRVLTIDWPTFTASTDDLDAGGCNLAVEEYDVGIDDHDLEIGDRDLDTGIGIPPIAVGLSATAFLRCAAPRETFGKPAFEEIAGAARSRRERRLRLSVGVVP